MKLCRKCAKLKPMDSFYERRVSGKWYAASFCKDCMREVAIVGAGMTRFGELWKTSLRDLFAEAALEALESAGTDHLDAAYIGNMSGGCFVGQEHVGPVLVSQIGMAGIPATRVARGRHDAWAVTFVAMNERP